MISHPTHFVFISGRNYARIYSLPKSKIDFTADASDFLGTIIFSGDDQEVNNYLAGQNKIVKLAQVNSENFLYASDYSIFKSALDVLMQNMHSNFDDFAKENAETYPDFVKMEIERLRLFKGTILLTYYTPVVTSNKIIEDAETSINQIISETDLNNPELIGLTEFKPFVQNMMAYLLNKKVQEEKLEFTSAEEYAKFYFAKIDEYFVENTVKEELYYSFLKDFISYYGAESVVEPYNTYKDIATNKERLSELDKTFSEYNKLAKGQASVNWTFPDIDGKNYSLSDFKGKYVYIDVWASWCGPCKRELPYLTQLKEKFADKNIAIIQISVDENRADWVNLMQTENLQGIQLFTGGWANSLCDHFKITGIPRFILLDMDGNIINSNADRPSGDIETVLNSLEGI
jgi:thiol-disulfide isomerase/thioredoxin